MSCVYVQREQQAHTRVCYLLSCFCRPNCSVSKLNTNRNKLSASSIRSSVTNVPQVCDGSRPRELTNVARQYPAMLCGLLCWSESVALLLGNTAVLAERTNGRAYAIQYTVRLSVL